MTTTPDPRHILEISAVCFTCEETTRFIPVSVDDLDPDDAAAMPNPVMCDNCGTAVDMSQLGAESLAVARLTAELADARSQIARLTDERDDLRQDVTVFRGRSMRADQ